MAANPVAIPELVDAHELRDRSLEGNGIPVNITGFGGWRFGYLRHCCQYNYRQGRAPCQAASCTRPLLRMSSRSRGFVDSSLIVTACTREAEMEVGHAAAPIDVDQAATNQHLAELLPPALHPRLHPRHRDARVAGRIGLGQTLKRGQFDRRPVWLRKPTDHPREARREFGLSRSVDLHVRLGREIDVQRIGTAIAALTRAKRVPHGIARNPKQPGFGSIRATQGIEVADHAQEDLLQQVLRIDTRGYRLAKNARNGGPKSSHSAEASLEGGDAIDSVMSGGLSAMVPPITVIPPCSPDTKTPVRPKGRKREP